MKILFCTSYFDNTYNGAGQFAQHLFRLNEKFPQHEIRVLSEDVKEAVRQFPNKFYSVTVSYPFFLKPLSMVLRAFSYHRQAVKVKQSYQYDIIFYNNIFAAWWSALMFSNNTKVLGFIHDYSFIHYNLRSFRWTTSWLYRYFYHLAELIAANLVDTVFSNSNYLKKEIESKYNIHPKKEKKIYLSIDIANIAYCEALPIKTNETIKILFIKNNFQRGGLIELVKATTLLSNKYRFKISVIGPLVTERDRIKTLFKDTNVELDFRGNQSQSVVFQAFRTHHILCIPSQKEALGVANMEGLAHGIPIVATNVGGIPEVTKGNHCAWIAKPSNPKSLASAIRKCIESPVERLEKSLTGRKHVETHFNYHQMLTETVTILENLSC